MARLRYLLGTVGALLVVAACGSGGDPQPTAVLSGAELTQWEAEAAAFADRYYGAWPDVEQTFAEFADGATFYDPASVDGLDSSSGDIVVEGKTSIVALWGPFFRSYSDIEAVTRGIFLSTDAAAFPVTLNNVWPPWSLEPMDHPPMEAIEVLRFEDGLATGLDIWYPEDTLEMTDTGCFAAAGCTPDLRALAERYVAAWSSGDRDQIAALYAADAVFTDGMFGFEVRGADAIGDLALTRFGASEDVDLEVVALAATTNGPTTLEARPELGRIIGLGIHYRWSIAGEPTAVESFTTIDLGTRGTTFDLHPDGLITHEVVFHRPTSLVGAGLTR